MRRTENSLRVGDELQERRNTAVSLLISAGRKPFRCVFWTIYLLQLIFLILL